MSGADDLRATIAQEIADYLRDLGDGGISPGTLAARITDRLDVTRSPYHECHLGDGPVTSNCQTPVGSCACNERNPLFVVRPRGEATE